MKVKLIVLLTFTITVFSSNKPDDGENVSTAHETTSVQSQPTTSPIQEARLLP